MTPPDPDPEAGPPAAVPSQPLARTALDLRKRRDAARALPLAGVFLLASPFLDLFAAPLRVFGIPLGVAYVFAVWLTLIGAAALLAGRLADDDGG